MTVPTCPHCQATRFEVTLDEPIGSDYKLFLVHCHACGAPVGAMEYVVTSVVLKKQEETLAQFSRRFLILLGAFIRFSRLSADKTEHLAWITTYAARPIRCGKG